MRCVRAGVGASAGSSSALQGSPLSRLGRLHKGAPEIASILSRLASRLSRPHFAEHGGRAHAAY